MSVSILKDGGRNLRDSVKDLLDSRATTVDGKHPHPLIDTMAELVRHEPWVDDAAVRIRDMGRVFHAESSTPRFSCCPRTVTMPAWTSSRNLQDGAATLTGRYATPLSSRSVSYPQDGPGRRSGLPLLDERHEYIESVLGDVGLPTTAFDTRHDPVHRDDHHAAVAQLTYERPWHVGGLG